MLTIMPISSRRRKTGMYLCAAFAFMAVVMLGYGLVSDYVSDDARGNSLRRLAEAALALENPPAPVNPAAVRAQDQRSSLQRRLAEVAADEDTRSSLYVGSCVMLIASIASGTLLWAGWYPALHPRWSAAPAGAFLAVIGLGGCMMMHNADRAVYILIAALGMSVLAGWTCWFLLRRKAS